MATAVLAVLPKESEGSSVNNMPAIEGQLTCDYRELDLPLAKTPTREELVQTAGSTNRIDAACAKHLLAALDRGEKIAANYPYPIQTWRLGTNAEQPAAGVNLVILGGEVVVDYALAIKQELRGRNTWVAAYANDVMAYIPSRRILQEGGYEGIGAQSEYGFLSPWSPDAEKLILDEVRRQTGVAKVQ
jgi:neutral ceramidase